MKTTIELADDLALILKKKTTREGISMRAAIHDALRLWLKCQSTTPEPLRISRDIGLVSGRGLTPEAVSASWSDLRALSYDQRG